VMLEMLEDEKEEKAEPKAKVEKKPVEKKETAVKKEVEKKPVKGKKQGIGNYVYEILKTKEGWEFTNTEILEKVKNQFPEAKTTIACISWYRGQINKR